MKSANLSCGCQVTRYTKHSSEARLCKVHTTIGQALDQEEDKKRLANVRKLWDEF